ncbi:MAG: SufS family cysteine desulfurase [Euzebyales bacterium]|nr:SufS family cysteine desulfurase [Euzebyales bacterium]MBA3620832.1 SufS family cysteine desulfurase [Euzebyales bacterium]
MLDVARIRKDFPVLQRQVHGRPLVYLNSAATSQKPQVVIDAVARFYEERNSNVHRGVDALSEEATQAFEDARGKIARFVGADPRALVFTRNATEAFNVVAYSWARTRLGEGDIVLSTQMEHHANIVPWQLVQPEAGFELRYVPVVAESGQLDLDVFDEIVASGRVKLFTVTAMSNVVGTINPVAELAARVRAANADAVVVVDGAQSVPHVGTDLLALDADFLCFSGHKMLGPSGIGALAAKPELLEAMPPFLGGGEMISNVTLEGTTFNEIPHKFEAGTMPAADAVGFGAAVDYLNELGMDAVRAHEVELLGTVIPALEAVEGVTVHGPKDPSRRGAAVSFAVEGLHPHDIGTVMDREGVAVRAGHHCAKPLVRVFGTAATTRASFYLYNSLDDVGALIDAIDVTKRFFAR